MDEVGFLVREIDEQGYIRMLPVGGWWGLMYYLVRRL
ncbi:MAG: hypothetical protein ACLTTH_10490 [Holdemanella porci]